MYIFYEGGGCQGKFLELFEFQIGFIKKIQLYFFGGYIVLKYDFIQKNFKFVDGRKLNKYNLV